MKHNSYNTEITFERTPDEVFSHLKNVSAWWSKDFEGHSTALNDEFIICHPGQHYTKQKLIEVVPGQKLVWLVTESELDWLTKDKKEWTNTKMIFEISVKDHKTVLHFTHEGLVPEKECYTRCTGGWNMVIHERLYDYINFGKTI